MYAQMTSMNQVIRAFCV